MSVKGMSIEEVLGLSEDNIVYRMTELKFRTPTVPGKSYWEARLKEYDAGAWPFVNYLAHYFPEQFTDFLKRYSSYNGNENREVLLERLRDYYILGRVLLETQKIGSGKTITVEAKDVS
jgi:hypothetical protein